MSRRFLGLVLALAAAVVSLALPSASHASARTPSAPTSTSAIAADGRITVRWQAPTSTGGSPVTAYVVRRAPSATGPWTTAATVGAARRSATVVGLANGSTYFVDVRARNAQGTGTPGHAIRAVPFTVPGAPPSLAATPGDGVVHLSWGVAAPHGSAITAYVVKRLVDTTWTTIGATRTTGLDATGLSDGTPVSFRVLAQNAAGNGPLSGIVSSTPRTHPDPPTSLTATPRDGAVRLDWQQPSDNGSSITGYVVQQHIDDVWTEITTVTGTTFTVYGLTNGTPYSFRVLAQNAAGNGDAASATTAPMALAAAPVVTDASLFLGYLYLDWTQAGEADSQITHWSVERYVDGAWTHLVDMTRTQNQPVVPATYGESFALRISAVNPSGTGPASAVVVVQDQELPAQPSLTGTSTASGTLDLAWDVPVAAGDPTIDSVSVTVDPNGICSNSGDTSRYCYASQYLTGNTRATTISGLVSGVQYDVTVSVCTNTMDLQGGQQQNGKLCSSNGGYVTAQ